MVPQALQKPSNCLSSRAVSVNCFHKQHVCDTYELQGNLPCGKVMKKWENWATERMPWGAEKWISVLCPDEKKFNLDGLKGLKYK